MCIPAESTVRSGPKTGWIATRVWPYGGLPAFPLAARAIERFGADDGLTLLRESILYAHVAGVSLDLSEAEDVTVLKCLFFDYECEFRKGLLVTG